MDFPSDTKGINQQPKPPQKKNSRQLWLIAVIQCTMNRILFAGLSFRAKIEKRIHAHFFASNRIASLPIGANRRFSSSLNYRFVRFENGISIWFVESVGEPLNQSLIWAHWGTATSHRQPFRCQRLSDHDMYPLIRHWFFSFRFLSLFSSSSSSSVLVFDNFFCVLRLYHRVSVCARLLFTQRNHSS